MVIEPIHHVPCLTEAAEEVADEVRNFQKCVIRMLESRGQHAVFLEQHYAPGGRGAAGVAGCRRRRAIRLQVVYAHRVRAAHEPRRQRGAAYFRKAILESGEEWSQHRKLHELKNGTVRLTVLRASRTFASRLASPPDTRRSLRTPTRGQTILRRDVLEGILEHEDSGIPLARRKAEPFEERLQQRVVAVTKAFAPYDWTKQM